MRVFALPGMVMIACPPALTSGGAVGLPLAAPPTVQIPTDQGGRLPRGWQGFMSAI